MCRECWLDLLRGLCGRVNVCGGGDVMGDVRVCVVCGKRVWDPEPGVDYCSAACFAKDQPEAGEK